MHLISPLNLTTDTRRDRFRKNRIRAIGRRMKKKKLNKNKRKENSAIDILENDLVECNRTSSPLLLTRNYYIMMSLKVIKREMNLFRLIKTIKLKNKVNKKKKGKKQENKFQIFPPIRRKHACAEQRARVCTCILLVRHRGLSG